MVCCERFLSRLRTPLVSAKRDKGVEWLARLGRVVTGKASYSRGGWEGSDDQAADAVGGLRSEHCPLLFFLTPSLSPSPMMKLCACKGDER